MAVALKDSVPPHNLDAEKATLGAMLLDWGAVGDVVVFLRAEDFYARQNQIVFNALYALFSEGTRGDAVSLLAKLSENGKLNEAGGASYISSLTDVVPSSANILYYANLVHSCAIRRELIRISSEIKASSFDETKETRSILDEAEQKIFDIANTNQTTKIYQMDSVVIETFQLIERNMKNEGGYTGIPSGIIKLDSMTSGFQKSELIVVGARPSMGKTALALSFIQNIAIEKKIPCGFFSLEMAYPQIGQRLLSQVSKVPGFKFKSGCLTKADLSKLQEAAGQCYDAPIFIVDQPNMQIVDLRAMARRMVANHNVEIIFIDYIGLITTQNSSAPVYEQVSEISKSLKSLARELNVPIVALCQVSREAEGEEPNLSQLRGSGSIEQDADVVMFIHRERRKNDDDQPSPAIETKLIVAKQRNGPIGEVKTMFLTGITKFENALDE